MAKPVKVMYCEECENFVFEWRRYSTRYCTDSVEIDEHGCTHVNDYEVSEYDWTNDLCYDCDEELTEVELPEDLFEAVINKAYEKDDYYYHVALGNSPEKMTAEEVKAKMLEALLA